MTELTGTNNQILLCGSVAAPPRLSHRNREEDFYIFPLEVQRLSGATDVLNILARKRLLEELEVESAEKLRVLGQVRSFNNKSGVGARLVISVFARELAFASGEDENLVRLRGTLCKPPTLRQTPMGREISDLMVAVNRRYGRSDYIPCIAWGAQAHAASALHVGDCVSLEGRLQSRVYLKTMDGVALEKTAYELSLSHLEQVDPGL